MKQVLVVVVSAALLTAAGLPARSAPPVPSSPAVPVHVRGTLRSVSAKALTVSTSTGPVQVQVVPPLVVRTLRRASAAQIRNGAFVGITSVRQPDGTQRAVEVHIFPESMRGAGEGTRPWDLPGVSSGSVMTNGTVSRPAPESVMTNGTVRRGKGSSITVQYKGTSPGSQAIVIPPTARVVAIQRGTPAALKRGAHVFIIAARKPGGTLTTSSITVGLNGLVPPM